jgi:membrane-associated HD superfamily phosphohydrolase
VVTEQQLAMLTSLGLLEDTHVDTSMYVGMAALTALMYGLMLLYLYQFEPELLNNPKETVLLTLVLLLVVALGLMLKGISIYLIPVQMGTIIIAMLLHQRLAITFNVVIGVIAGILGAGNDGILTSSMFQMNERTPSIASNLSLNRTWVNASGSEVPFTSK